MATNVVPNPSFEYDTNGQAPAGWVSGGGGVIAVLTLGATLTVTNAQSFVGSQSCQVVTTATVNEGLGVTLSAMGAPPGGYQTGVTYEFQVMLMGGAGGELLTLELGNSSSNRGSLTNITLTSAWAAYTATWTPSSSVSQASVIIRTNSATAYTFFVDAVLVAQGSAAGTYFDGDSPGWHWQGVPGNSPSSTVDVTPHPVPVLPRSAGPKAVGPTFFAALQPVQRGSPAQPGVLRAPVYLPRRLGPKAVGPAFFAALQPAQPGQAAIGIWLPAETFPAQRNRVFAGVRGRRTFAPPPQEIPVLAQRPAPLPRDLFTLTARGKRAFPTQPQIPVPAMIPGTRSVTGRRMTALVKGRQWLAPVAQQAVTLVWPPPKVGQAKRLLAALARGRRTAAPAAQQAPVRASLKRSVTVPPVRGRGTRTAPLQDMALKAPRLSGRLAALRRGRQATVTLPQVSVPAAIPGNRSSTARSKLAALRRGRMATPVLGQAQAPASAYPPVKLGAARRLLSGVQRGRQSAPVPGQVSVPRTVPGNRQPAARRGLGLVRRRRSEPPFSVSQVIPQWSPATVRRALARLLAGRPGARSRLAPPGQADSPPMPARPPRAKAPSRPGTPPRTPTPGQTGAPPSAQRRGQRILALRRGRRSETTPPQVPVPKWPPGIVRSLPQWGWLRRGKRTDPPAAKAAATSGTPIALVLRPLPAVAVVLQPVALHLTLTPLPGAELVLAPLPAATLTVDPAPPVVIVTHPR